MILASTFTEQTLPLIVIAVCGVLSMTLVAIRYRRRSTAAQPMPAREEPKVPDLTAGL